jgi:ABC-type Na+ efflux pump permease subunit
MKSKLFRVFRQGLLKIAKTTGWILFQLILLIIVFFVGIDVWIITCGINSSVTKLLGEIIRTHPDPSHPIYLMVSYKNSDMMNILFGIYQGNCAMGMYIRC